MYWIDDNDAIDAIRQRFSDSLTKSIVNDVDTTLQYNALAKQLASQQLDETQLSKILNDNNNAVDHDDLLHHTSRCLGIQNQVILCLAVMF
jgi:hypothetical protein